MNSDILLEHAITIARGAGEIVLDCYRKRVECRLKGDFDVVTEADYIAESFILERLREFAPDHAILTEESGDNAKGHPYRWYVDPLDGTKNFAHGHACFCTMLALEHDGELELAVVFDPVRNEMFTAQRGRGAWCNGTPMAVSTVAHPAAALLTSGFPSSKRHRSSNTQVFLDMAMGCQGLRRTGCSGLDFAYVAAGRFDAVWDSGLEPWDVAPGMLLVREAGGQCTDWRGEPYRIGYPDLFAANPVLHRALLPVLQRNATPGGVPRRQT
jgi:myo-inositol-1(or 4)-monophosphatase